MEGRWRRENIRFVIRACYGKVRETICRFVAGWSRQQHGVGPWSGSPVPGGGCCVEFAKQSIGKAPIGRVRDGGMGKFCNGSFGSVVYL